MPGESTIAVRVVCALPDRASEVTLDVPADCGARAVLSRAIAAGLQLQGSNLDPATVPLGVHGRRVGDGECLREGDRLELYRPLEQDPMTRRRREAARGRG